MTLGFYINYRLEGIPGYYVSERENTLRREKLINQSLNFNESMVICNIESGFPTLNEARINLKEIIIKEKKNNTKAIKLIHGYGSSGVGGKLRQGLRESLRRRKKEGEIKGFIIGENFSNRPENDEYIKQNPFFVNDPDFGKGNLGITIIIL